MRHVRFEIANRLVECLDRLQRFRRKELKRERGRIPPHDISDVHDSAATFVRSATFGQPAGAHFRAALIVIDL